MDRVAARRGERHEPATTSLGDLFSVKRGLATGSNEFFIVPRERLRSLGIPTSCVRPILPSPRFLKQEIIDADTDGWPVIDKQLALIDCSLTEEEINGRFPRFAAYLADGKRQRINEGYLASRREPWYSQEKREPATFVCTYMGRNRERPFRFIWNRSKATVANVYLALYPKPHVVGKLKERTKEVFERAAGNPRRRVFQPRSRLRRRASQNGAGGANEVAG